MMGWTICDWQTAYRNGERPSVLLKTLRANFDVHDPAWISLVDPDRLDAQIAALEARAACVSRRSALPLYGVPFAVKDNIDVAAMETTAGCPAYAYVPKANSAVVQSLIDAGAIVMGKTNLDQFATGLVGTRSPFGAVPNAFDPAYISGGSSAGSASVVARGLVPFSLGTDTAGSGRVPAGLNNIVGLKPTVGALSGRGVVPACRTLDCISVFATTVSDAELVLRIAAVFDAADSYSRKRPSGVAAALPAKPRFGVPKDPEFFGDAESAAAFSAALNRVEQTGAVCVPLDFDLFDRVAALLYDGPWVAERYAAIEDFAEQHPESMNPVVRDIIFRARDFSAADAFKAQYALAELKRAADAVLASVDALLVPTTPTHYRTSQIEADPVRLNSRLGKYTNFVNLLGWCALAVPAGFRGDGLPFGITLIGPAWADLALTSFGKKWQALTGLRRGATGKMFETQGNATVVADPAPEYVRLAVVGAHLSGMPLNRELTERHATLVESTKTANSYRLYALQNTSPAKPGLARETSGTGKGSEIEVELWDMPMQAFASFVAAVPAPLGIGTLELNDGRHVKGFICEPHALEDAKEITHLGGWRAYCALIAGERLENSCAQSAPI